MINLGVLVIDPETGFKGKVTARAEYLYGEPRVMVENVDATGRPIEWWFEESRVEMLSTETILKEDAEVFDKYYDVGKKYSNLYKALKINLKQIEELDEEIATLK